MKDDTHFKLLPHCEWFCTHLARRIGIPSIDCKVLKLPATSPWNGKEAFGSRYMPVEIPPTPVAWWVRIQQGSVAVSHVATVLSWIYAFDHFVHNVDRHATNFFAQKSHAGFSILSMDYSKAWLWNKFPLPDPPFDLTDPHHKTVFAQRSFTTQWHQSWIINEEVRLILERIREVKKNEISEYLRMQPKEWLPESRRRAIVKWWGSKEFESRIDTILAGITNGTTNYI